MASSVNEGKKIMITQAIKRWFQKMFAWWPGNRSKAATYVDTTAIRYYESTQETISHATLDGTTNQANSSTYQAQTDEWPTEQYVLPPLINEPPEVFRPALPTPPVDKGRDLYKERQNSAPEQNSIPSPPQQTSNQRQQLEFLYYLVKKGIVNEGFERDDTPDQYRLP